MTRESLIDSYDLYVDGRWVEPEDVERAASVARRMRTGQVAVNGDSPAAAAFGGFKQSGLGREGGVAGLRQYMEPRGIGVPG